MLYSVKVPKHFEPIFKKAQAFVKRYFKEFNRDARKGTLKIAGERYLLVRAASMSVDFFETVKDLYKEESEEEALDVACSLLFDIAHAIGKADARNFHKKMKLKDPIEKLSAGPIHFAHSGWAFVDIFPESNPTPDENYYLVYDHPFSFESAAWKKARKKSEYPVCIMNAGYSSGWCEESFGVTLVASEIMCKAKGDKACRFIMAHPSRIEGYIERYIKGKPKLAKRMKKYEIPSFFRRKQVEAALQESEARYRELLDNVPCMVYRGRKDWSVETMSPYAREISGYRREDFERGRVHWLDLVYRDDRQRVLAESAALTQGQPGVEQEYRIVRKGGRIAWVRDIKRALFRGGEYIGVDGFVVDVSDRRVAEEALQKAHDELERRVDERTLELTRANDELKRAFDERVRMGEELRKSRELYQTLAETAEDYFFIINRDMTVQYVNNYGVRTLSCTQGEVVGRHLSTIFPPQTYENFERALKHVVETGMPHSAETEADFPTGRVWLHTHLVPLKDERGEVFAVMGLSRDFTDRINLENEVRQALKVKSDFMATMSHELRTPLNSIIGCTDLVLNDTTLNLSDKRIRNLKSVMASADELLAIINNILDMARIEAGKIPISPERFPLSGLIDMSVESCRGIALHKSLEMVVEVKDDLPDLYTDKEKLGHIVVNLLSNAIKFTERGRVRVSASAMPGQPDEVIIAVSDTGIGIPVERRGEIFERFKQVDASTTRRHGGIGLGLAIVKSYVELLGGSIQVESEVGRGSTFTIRLPMVLNRK